MQNPVNVEDSEAKLLILDFSFLRYKKNIGINIAVRNILLKFSIKRHKLILENSILSDSIFTKIFVKLISRKIAFLLDFIAPCRPPH